MIILEWILKKQSEKLWTECIYLQTGTNGGFCEGGNETSGSLKGGEFFDQRSDY